MSIFRRHRLGRRQSEQLLDGAAVPTGFDDLARLLAAARGTQPADSVPDGELPGERAALAAFRATFDGTTEVLSSGVGARSSDRTGPLPAGSAPEENTPVRTLALRRMLAVKVLAAGALTVSLGGVAMAATGVPFVPGHGHRNGAAPAVTVTPGGSPTGRPTASGSHDKDGDKADPSKSGRPTGLRPGLDDRAKRLIACRLYLADHRKPAATPSQNQSGRHFEDLVKAAGGQDKVAAYCAALVKICPTFSPGATAGAIDGRSFPGYLPGCPKPDRPTGTRTMPVPTKSHPQPTHTSVPPIKTTKPVQGGMSGRPTTLPPMP